jgi:hypothetical protein
MNQSEVPNSVLQADWDHERVAQLFADLQAGAHIIHVQVRTAVGKSPSDRETTLAEAHSLLDSGDAKAIQIRYDYEGQLWYDTLMVNNASIRVIRTLAGDAN